MAIYRGPGGPGDAVADAASEAALISALVTQAQTAEANAGSSASAASVSASAAATSASNAASSASAAEASKNASLNFGNVLTVSATTLSAGASATVSYNSTNTSISFGIPTGLQGPQGIQGIQGPAGTGNVDGPTSSTDNAVVRFDSTTGKLIQNSSLIVNDSGEVTTGVWKGTEITVPYGGTGAASFTVGALLKGNGSNAITTATAGTDYVSPSVATTFTAQQTFSVGSIFENRILEKTTISATAATGTINYDTITQSILYYTTNASGNWTINIRGNSSTTLNSLLSTGQSITVVFMVTNGSTAYYQTAFQIDGSSVTPKWQGSTPAAGTINSIEVYVYNIIKTGASTFTVLASKTAFV